MEYAGRRLSSLLVLAGASTGIIGAVLAEAAGASPEVSLGLGSVLFLTGTAVGHTLGSQIRRHTASTGESEVPDARGWGSSMQLGPDPEQVVGRMTGART
jgi:hypothetical protein